ncbi:hypothetical protein F5Y05DRAFT_416198 [Hypoxylon sp. FL0543]|nr:hypothetical protein F5Y05DRAFT_416198 [Hypoxylon sp. FL0543]
MRCVTLLTLLLTPLGVVSVVVPTRTGSLYALHPPTKAHDARSNVVTPPPCVAMHPAPNQQETRARFDRFAYAFLVKRNLTESFEYISSKYINHDLLAGANGPDAALNFLSTIWDTVNFTNPRTAFRGNQGWLSYDASGVGAIVDRFRWEAGCIVEHWDTGEKFPKWARK